MVAWHARSLNWARTAVGVGVLAVLAACGGGGGGSSSTSGGGGGGGSASVSGVASKGLLLNALVTAYAVNSDGSRGSVLATTSTSATDGSYTLSGLPAGALVLLEVTPKATGTKMIDETTNAEVDVLANSGFKLRAATSLDSSGTTSAQITPFTDMAVKLAEDNNGGRLNADVVTAANGSVSAFVGISVLTERPSFTSEDGNVKPTNAAGAKLAAISKMANDGAVDDCASASGTVAKVKCVVEYLATQGTTSDVATKLGTATTAVLAGDAAISNPLELAKAQTEPVAQPTTLPPVVTGTQTGVQEAKTLIRSVRTTAAALSNESDATSLAARVQAMAESAHGVAQPLDDGTIRAVSAITDAMTEHSAIVAGGLKVDGFTLYGYGWQPQMPYATSQIGSGCRFFTDNTFETPAYRVEEGVPTLSTTDFMACRVLQHVVWEGYTPKYAVFNRVRLSKLNSTQFKVESIVRKAEIIATPIPMMMIGPFPSMTSTAYTYSTTETNVSSGLVSATATRSATGWSLAGDLAPGVEKTWTYNALADRYDENVRLLGTKQTVALSYSDTVTVATHTTRRALTGDVRVYAGADVQSRLSLLAGSYVEAQRVFTVAGPVGGELLPKAVHLVMEGQVKTGFKINGTLDMTDFLMTDARWGFAKGSFAGSFTDVGGTAKLFDGTLLLDVPNDSGAGAAVTLDGVITTTGANTLTVRLAASQSATVPGDYTVSGRYTQGTTTFLVTVFKSESSPDTDSISFQTAAGGVGFVAKPSDTRVDVKKGDAVVGVFNVSTGRLVYADGSYEQF